MNGSIKTKTIIVEVQENGIIRNNKGRIIARFTNGIEFEGEHIIEEKMIPLSEVENIHLAVMKQGCLYEGGDWSDEHERLVRLEFNKWSKENL